MNVRPCLEYSLDSMTAQLRSDTTQDRCVKFKVLKLKFLVSLQLIWELEEKI